MKRSLALFLFLAFAGTFFAVNTRAQTGPGSALVFNGVNQLAAITLFGTNMPTNEITVELWQNVASNKIQGSFSLFPDSTVNRLNAHVPWIDGVVYWDFGNINTAGRLFYTPPTPFTNSWQHFAFVASSNGNYMRIYRNGVLEAQKTGMTPFVRGNVDLNIGQVGGGYFAGQIDEFRIWNVARSSNEIATNFMRSLTGNEPGLLLYLRCNEGSGTQTADAAPLGGNTTAFLQNGVAWSPSFASVGGLFATMADSLLIDTNNNGKVNSGDTLRYTITIQNNSTNTLTNVVLNVPGNTNTTLVPGSVKVPPKAVDDGPASNSVPGNAFHVALNTAFNLSAPGLLSNDTLGAPAGSIASFGGGSFAGTASTTPAGSPSVAGGVGSLTVNANGSVTFTPTATFNGLATFQYRLTNAQGASIANGTIAVGARPLALNDSYLVTGNTMLDTTLDGLKGVLNTDSGDLIAISGNTSPAHGTLTLNVNGNFLYTPAAAYTGSDSFTYTITNGFGLVGATVNLTVTNLLWYIDNSVAVNGDGRSSSPFKNTSDFTAVNDGAAGHPADNQYVFLRQGTGNYTGSTLLRNGQKLIGDGATVSFNSLFGFSLVPGSAKAAGVPVPGFTGVRPFISVPSGTGVSLGSGNTVSHLNVHSANGRGFSGASVGSLVITNVGVSSFGDRVLSLASGSVFMALDRLACTNSVDNGINLSAIDGTLGMTFSGSAIVGAAGTDFLVTGGSANITLATEINNTAGRSVDINGRTGGQITLTGNISDTGTGLIVQNCTGGSVTFSGASKVFNTAGNTAITLNTNASATVNFSNGGLNVDTTSGTAFSVLGSGNVNVTGSGNTIDATTGTAFLNSGTGGSATIDINAPLVNTTGRLIDIQNRTAGGTVTFSGNLNNGGTGILIQNNSSGGTITLSGTTKTLSTGGNAAVNLANNTGTTINFSNGGLGITTTTGTGFNATGGGTITIPTGGSVNTISSSSATALNVANTTIGVGGLNFQSISSGTAGGGPAKGISLNNTGTGGLTITGVGSTDGSGGTIQDAAAGTTMQRGIEIISSQNISLNNMTLLNACRVQGAVSDGTFGGNENTDENGAIHLQSVTNVTFNNVDINGSVQHGINGNLVTHLVISNSVIQNAGNAVWESGIYIFNLRGTSAAGTDNKISATTISHTGQFNLFVQNNSSTSAAGSPANYAAVNRAAMDQLTLNNCIFQDSGVSLFGDNVTIVSNNGGNMRTVVSNTTFTGTVGGAFGTSDNIQVDASGTGHSDLDLGTSTFTGGGQTAINVSAAGTGFATFDVHNNSNINTLSGPAINVAINGASKMRGFVRNNPSVYTTVANSASSGVNIVVDQNGLAVVDVNNNVFKPDPANATHLFGNAVIRGGARNANGGEADLTIQNNTVTGAKFEGLELFSGNNSAGELSTVKVHFVGNDINGGAGFDDYLLDQYTNDVFQIQGLTPASGASEAQVEAFVAGTDPGSNCNAAGGLLITYTAGTPATP